MRDQLFSKLRSYKLLLACALFMALCMGVAQYFWPQDPVPVTRDVTPCPEPEVLREFLTASVPRLSVLEPTMGPEVQVHAVVKSIQTI